ncbi:5-bromo-4-chloroindolyl phosphate hydrolysis protein [Anaerotaenia torta]|uniref:5-bromo-4-chloroindolyl phosphate hydrolysis family protein n=1 Tax=Anaerotaenia torta TaxID=433293 RepID=UPI003D1A533E
MSQKNFSNLGDEIRDIVQNAVSTMDFHHINRDIEHTVRSALSEIRGSLGINKPGTDKKEQKGPEGGEAGNDKNRWNSQNGGNSRTSWQQNPVDWRQAFTSRREYRQNGRDYRTAAKPNSAQFGNNAVVPKQKSGLVPYVEVGRVSGILLTVFGGIGTGVFGISVLVLMILAFTLPGLGFLATIALGLSALLVPSLLMMAKGGKNRKRLKRFRRYLKIIGGRGYCTLNELAQSTGWSKRFVLKDVRRMISIGMFSEGRIDEQQTCVILNRESYQQYLETMRGARTREIEQGARGGSRGAGGSQQTAGGSAAASSPENEVLKKALENGRDCIRQMKEANEEIPGEEISRKLYHLELVTGRIFDYVESHPPQLPEIQKFMEYYLPTTLKLVNAYREFDRQPVQGDNITTAKKEIETTLDTINHAFETLLDSLYGDAAMDVSTDISVLETMLAQEGLTPGELKAKKMNWQEDSLVLDNDKR